MITTQTPTESIEALMRVTAQSEAAFHAAVAIAHNDEARALLLDRAYRFARAAGVLRLIARAQGVAIEQPAQGGSASRLVGDDPDDLALLAECERREDLAIVAFRDALEATLPHEVRRAIEHEFDGLLACLGSLRALRERLARRPQRARAPQAM
jgi:uncharacterized protein (TIGR02284 family)